MTEKLAQELVQVEIKQTSPLRFKDEAINKIRKQNIKFGKRTDVIFPFIVSKDSHLKGLKLRVYKGSSKDPHTKKVFYFRYWFNGRACRYSLGQYSQTFGTKECDELLRQIYLEHTDSKTGYWIKDPNETRRNQTRIVEKPDTTQPKGYTINNAFNCLRYLTYLKSFLKIEFLGQYQVYLLLMAHF